MKDFGRSMWLREPGVCVSLARPPAFTVPACCNGVSVFPTCENSGRGAVRLVFHLFQRMFCPVVAVRLQPCAVVAAGIRLELTEIRPNRRNPTVG